MVHYPSITITIPILPFLLSIILTKPAFDTSPYYGDSEIVMGAALHSMRPKYPRDSYTLTTKCGRISFAQFDYSPASIRRTVNRSLTRLHTTYLDVVLLHDAEFVSSAEVVAAARQLVALKQEGKIRAWGLSGYDLTVLLGHAQAIQEDPANAEGPEVFFSYCHYNLQNSLLSDFLPRFRALGIKQIINGSPLSMGLLRAEKAPGWHPASPELKEACVKASEFTESVHGEKLADVALRYALGFEGTTCVGCSSLRELDTAVEAWRTVQRRRKGEDDTGKAKDEKVFGETRKMLTGEWAPTWACPPEGWVREPIAERDGNSEK